MICARVWILWGLAAVMIAAEAASMAAMTSFVQGSPVEHLGASLLMVIVTGIPYLAMAIHTIAYSRRYSATLWVVVLGMLLVAAGSCFFRAAEFAMAREVWEARMHGHEYMNCAPPARLVIWVLDYGGTGAVATLAGAVFLVQLIAASNTPLPPSPPPSRLENSPR